MNTKTVSQAHAALIAARAAYENAPDPQAESAAYAARHEATVAYTAAVEQPTTADDLSETLAGTEAVSPVLAKLLHTLIRAWGDEHAPLLEPFVFAARGTDDGQDEARKWLILDALVREVAPLWLDRGLLGLWDCCGVGVAPLWLDRGGMARDAIRVGQRPRIVDAASAVDNGFFVGNAVHGIATFAKGETEQLVAAAYDVHSAATNAREVAQDAAFMASETAQALRAQTWDEPGGQLAADAATCVAHAANACAAYAVRYAVAPPSWDEGRDALIEEYGSRGEAFLKEAAEHHLAATVKATTSAVVLLLHAVCDPRNNKDGRATVDQKYKRGAAWRDRKEALAAVAWT